MDTTEPPRVVIAAPETTEATEAPSPWEQPPSARLAVDLGIGTFLRSGVALDGVVGVSPFLTDELGRGGFVRLAASIGRNLGSGTLHMTWITGRLDACMESEGNYARGSNLRLDLCGGADVGGTFIASVPGGLTPLPARPLPSQSLPFIALGPSVGLRAEIGSRAAIVLRAAIGVNIARDTYIDTSGARIDPPLETTQFDIGFTWTLSALEPAARSATTALAGGRLR